MMQERALRGAIDDYFARHPAEIDMRASLEPLLPLGASLLDRTHVPCHWTASAWIVDASREMALVLFHRKLQMWLQPGGHADGDWDMPAVALREAWEETGLGSLRLDSPSIFDFDITPIPARSDMAAHAHLDVRYLLSADRAEPILESAESNGVKWVPMATLAVDADSGIRRMAMKTMALEPQRK